MKIMIREWRRLLLCVIFTSLITDVSSQTEETCVRKHRTILATNFDLGPPRKACCGWGKNRGDDAYMDWMLSNKPYIDPFAQKLSLKTMRQKREADPRLKHRKDEL